MANVRALSAILALLPAMMLPAGELSADTYPSHSVRLIVPFAAGGPTDVIARIVAQKLSEAWGQQVYTENVPGAGGNTGVTMAARAPADGYTMLVVSTGFIVNPSMYAKISYDPVKDFAPITLVAASPNVISVNPDFSAKSMKELVALVKSQSGQIQLRAAGDRLDPASRGRAVQAEIRTGPRHGTLQWRGAGGQLHHRGPHADRIHGAPAGHEQYQGGQAARARRARDGALRGPA